MNADTAYERYQTQMQLKGIGREGQDKLKSARVLIIGAGGLGCPVLLYLAAAGVGTIAIVDDDVVALSNLQRQVLFRESDVGTSKAKCAAIRLRELNNEGDYQPFTVRLNAANALVLVKDFDLVIDGSDNFGTKYLVNDACVELGKPFITGSVYQFSGQAGVFNQRLNSGELGPTYRCLFREPPPPESRPNCAASGVIGAVCGLVGVCQANEAIKLLTGCGETLAGKVLTVDLLHGAFETLTLRRTAGADRAVVLEQQVYDRMNGCSAVDVPTVTVSELRELLAAGEDVQLIDVRESHERESQHIGGTHLPLSDFSSLTREMIPDARRLVVYCHAGVRSVKAVSELRRRFQLFNAASLIGGITEWLKQAAS